MSAPATIHPAALHGAAIYRTSIAHVRRTPLRNAFTYRSYSWYVDVDHLPQLPRLLRPLAGFRVEDHLGDPDGTLRGNVESYLATQGIKLDGGRITMLASARVFGHVFNPLSVFWCHDAAGELRCVVAEVHNTYGERHCYLLETDDAGRASVPKAFYVSPFNDVDGEYRMKLPEPGERLAVSIVLEREGQQPFIATMDGVRHEASVRNIVSAALAVPAGPAACRGADPLAGHQTVGAPPAHHQKTTPPFTGGSSVTMTEATGSGTGRAQGTTHSSAVTAAPSTAGSSPAGCRTPFRSLPPPSTPPSGPASPRCPRASRPVWPDALRTPSSRRPCAGCRWKSGTRTAQYWAKQHWARLPPTRYPPAPRLTSLPPLPRHDHQPARCLRHPARRRRPDRPGRVLHGRRLGRR